MVINFIVGLECLYPWYLQDLFIDIYIDIDRSLEAGDSQDRDDEPPLKIH
jgi:hypothetical protein